MLRQILSRTKPVRYSNLLAGFRRTSSDSSSVQSKDEKALKQELNLTGIHFDDTEQLMCDEVLLPLDNHYPHLDVNAAFRADPSAGHNVVVIQPWVSYANFGEFTDPELQLAECVSLGNTVRNWKVIGKKIIFGNNFNKKELVGTKAFDELKDTILSHHGVTAVFFGVEILSGVQLLTLEKELNIAVYDRFTVVLNIIRQHARTKEAKLQVALAELPYLKSHLKEINQSSSTSSTDSLKLLIGGAGERSFHRRLNILKARESKLKVLIDKIKNHRDVTRRLRQRQGIPTVSVVGYTNSGKTSLVKYLSKDTDLLPKNELFATLDVTVHSSSLPSLNQVMFVDTVGFISRIPILLVEAFGVTLKDVIESDLIIHILDISHPDHRLQYKTVVSALETLRIPKNLLKTRITVGNKEDLINPDTASDKLPRCDIQISVTNGTNMNELMGKVDEILVKNINFRRVVMRVENGGGKYTWLRKNSTIIECYPDERDANYLICRAIMSPASLGRWHKHYGVEDIQTDDSIAGQTKDSSGL